MTLDHTVPLTTEDAFAAGITYDQLRGPGFVSVHRRRGLWLPAGVRPSFSTLLAADRLVLPPDAAVSHRTALFMYGVDIAPGALRHWTTTTTAHPKQRSLAIHRRAEVGDIRLIDDFPVVSPARCLADIAPAVPLAWLVSAGDALIELKATSLGEIRHFARRRIYGAKRLRIAASLMRTGSKSFRESGTRLIFRCAGMPEPGLNVDLFDDEGTFVACNDFSWRRWSTVAEYDGWSHERTKEQRNYDVRRLERIRDAGLSCVSLTSYDYDRPHLLAGRVWAKLLAGGWPAERPQFDWDTWALLIANPRRWPLPPTPLTS